MTLHPQPHLSSSYVHLLIVVTSNCPPPFRQVKDFLHEKTYSRVPACMHQPVLLLRHKPLAGSLPRRVPSACCRLRPQRGENRRRGFLLALLFRARCAQGMHCPAGGELEARAREGNRVVPSSSGAEAKPRKRRWREAAARLPTPSLRHSSTMPEFLTPLQRPLQPRGYSVPKRSSIRRRKRGR